MLSKIAIALVTLILGVSNANAQGTQVQWYGELGYGRATIVDDGYGLGTAGIGLGRIGVNFHKNVSAEVMAGTGLSSPSWYYGNVLITTSVNNMLGVYLKLRGQVSESTELFLRVGAVEGSGTISASSAYYRASATSFGRSPSYGVGVQFDFSKNVYGQIDWMSYYDYNGTSFKGPSASIGFKF